MTEEDARLALLLAELQALRNQIQDFETRIFQIKGWCVTTSLAIGGFAVAYRQPGLLAVGAGAVLGFFLMNCQFRYYWRIADRHNRALDAYLKSTGIMGVLKGTGSIEIMGTAAVHLSDKRPYRLVRNFIDIAEERRLKR